VSLITRHSLRPLISEGLVFEDSGRLRSAGSRRMREIVLDYQSIRHNEGARGEKRSDEFWWVAKRSVPTVNIPLSCGGHGAPLPTLRIS
jgi:hypothetical protein